MRALRSGLWRLMRVPNVRSELPCPASQQVSATPLVDEERWLELMAPVAARWTERAQSHEMKAGQIAYAQARARAASRPYGKRVDGCSRAGIRVACACSSDVRWFTCRGHLVCRTCRKQRARKLRPKIAVALEAAWARAPRGYQLVMVTIALPHDPDIGGVRKKLMAAWERFRKANHERWGKFFFVGTHEVTAGSDGLGHPHAHVVCLWPVGGPGDGSQGDWKLQRELWLDAAPTSTRINFTASKHPHKAARYISKYVTKGVQTSDFTPALRASVLAGTYNTRWLFSSAGAWVKYVPCCRCCGVSVTRVSLTWHGRCTTPPDQTPEWWYDRGPPQQALDI